MHFQLLNKVDALRKPTLGCWGRKKVMWWMKGDDGKANNSPAACQKFCQGFRYYGVQFTNQCFCGNNLHGDLKMKPESECKAICPGDASKKCGGSGKMNLYQAPPSSIVKQ